MCTQRCGIPNIQQGQNEWRIVTTLGTARMEIHVVHPAKKFTKHLWTNRDHD